MYQEHRDAIRTMLRRAAVVSTDDSGAQQLLTLSGLASEQLKKIVHVQQFGLSSNLPVGAEGVLLSLGGRSDRAMFIGGEDKASRPTGLPIGGTMLYDAFGQALKFVENNVTLVCGTLTITVTGNIKLGSASATEPVMLANNTPSTKVLAL